MAKTNPLKKTYMVINKYFDSFFDAEEKRLKKILTKIYHMQLSENKNNLYFTINSRSFFFKNNSSIVSSKDSSLCEKALPLGEHYSIFSNKYLKDKITISIYFQKLFNNIYYLKIDNPEKFFIKFFPEYISKIPCHNEDIINSYFKNNIEKEEYKRIIALLDSYEANKLIF